VSHLAPPNKAATPRMMSITVPPVDFFESALISTAVKEQLINAQEGRSRLLSPLAVKLSLITLKADAGDAQANQGEGQQHFPVRCRGLMESHAHGSQSQL